MNREEYLHQLKKYLKRLPSDDYQNAMDYFTEYFDEAGPDREAQVIEELGTPQEAAAELLAALLDEKTSQIIATISPSTYSGTGRQGRYRAGKNTFNGTKGNKKEKTSPLTIIWITVLSIFAAPIGIPIALSIFVLFLAGLIVLASGILCIFAFSISALFAGIVILIKGITLIPVSVSGACLLLGSGLLGIGFGVLLFIVGIFICKWIGVGLIRFTQWIIGKRKEKQHE